ncbi:myosin-11-like [Ylistrum balloti]|uniref:myosin-11-like n=1 Tax=Ylistrum balloti TaxID=509963 RepID=UPI0029058F86|nr:myosin-11-like [Ylistrum balloti]
MDLAQCRSQYEEIRSKEFLPMKKEYNSKDFLTDMSEFQTKKTNSKVYVPNMESRLCFHKFMGQDPETWTTKEEADLALKTASEKLSEEKKLVDVEKEKIEQLIEKTVADYEALQNNLKLIGEKLQVVEEKKSKLENLKAKQREVLANLGERITCPAEFYLHKKQQEEKIAQLTSAIELCQTSISRIGEEKRSLEETCHRLRISLEAKQQQQLQNNHSIQSQVKVIEDKLNRQKQLLTFMKQQSKVDIKQRSEFGQLVLELLSDEDKENIPRMFLTTKVQQDNLGLQHLASVETESGDCSLHTEDIISEALSTNDLRQLVTKMQDRWNTLFPLVQEMKNVSDRHAIDWIQDQNLLRILVGRGGSIMCTLHVPESYPFSGEITLQKTSNLPSDVKEEDILPPSECRSLQGWVDYLEETFGKP